LQGDFLLLLLLLLLQKGKRDFCPIKGQSGFSFFTGPR
jgi:hypothetical protein